MTWKLFIAHWKLGAFQIVRAPGYIISLFGFPAVFFLFFGIPEAEDTNTANRLMVSYTLYAVLGAVLNQVVGSIAEDRRETWYPYLNTLPRFQHARIASRVGVALASAAAAALFMIGVASLLTPVSLELHEWFFLSMAILLGFGPFLAMGLAIGYTLSPRSAPIVTSLIFFSLAYSGSLWTSPDSLPGWLRDVSWLIPTRMWAEVAWAATFDYSWASVYWGGLLVYGFVFGVIAILGITKPVRVRNF
ncbi:MAG: ABC transporter permease [Chloroflexota bacterium]